MIDLDQPPQYRTPRSGISKGGRRRALVLVVVGAFLAGGLLGGVATYVWWYQPMAASVEQADQAARSAVSVLLFAEPGVMTVHTEPRQVRIEAQVTVVNAGPEPVNVLALRVDQPGVTLRSPEKERQVAAGTAFPVDVVVEWNCVADETEALVASVSVETVDDQARKLSQVALDAAPWIESARAGCAG